MPEIRRYKFADLYEMNSGISTKPKQAGHGAPFLSFSTVFKNHVVPDKLTDLMATSEREQETYSVKAGDVFLTRTSETIDELGMSCVALKDYPKATYSGFLKRLRPKRKGFPDPKFMAFYLRGKLFRKAMTNNAVMVLRASLNEKIFSYLELLLPEIGEQIEIGELLYLLNVKINLNNRINTELETLTKTVFDYWFIQFDFPDEQGRPYKTSGGTMVWNSALKRKIPIGWEAMPIADLLLKQPSTTKVPTSAVQNAGRIPVIDQSTDFICGYTNCADAEIDVETAHVVFGDHTRIVKLVTFNYARGADGTQILIPNLEKISPFVFFHSVSSIDLSNYGYARHFKFLKDSLTVVPNIQISKKYDELAKSWFATIEKNRKETHELTTLREWLLPLLMNGQVRVKDRVS